jgi:hypothetical protein
MPNDEQTAAPTTTRRAAARTPGEAPKQTAAPTDEAAAGAEERTVAEQRFAIPDFRHKSAGAAQAWFEANPTAPKRGVLTHDGWYVPEGAHAVAGGKALVG